jgi:small-conductance mechanosensitive channel
MNRPLASISVSQSFQNLLDTVVHSIPKVLLFLVILVIGWIIARVLMQAVVMLLRKVNFDKFAERGVVGQSLARSKYDASSLIGKIVYYMILLVTLQLAFGVFGTNPVSTMLDAVVGWLPKAVVAIILVVVGSAIAKVVKDLITGAIGGLSYGRFVANLASIAIIAVFAIAALSQIGIAAAVTQPILITVLATIGAILAIGVGGGLIKPMQSRWERMLNAAEEETTRHVAAYQAGRQHAMQAPASTAEASTAEASTAEAQAQARAQTQAAATQAPGSQAGPPPPPAMPSGQDTTPA